MSVIKKAGEYDEARKTLRLHVEAMQPAQRGAARAFLDAADAYTDAIEEEMKAAQGLADKVKSGGHLRGVIRIIKEAIALVDDEEEK